MLQPSPRITTNDPVQAQLRALDKEHGSRLSVSLNNGHDDNAE